MRKFVHAWRVALVLLGFLVAGCSTQDRHPKAQIHDTRGFFSEGSRAELKAIADRIADTHKLSVAILAFSCGSQGAESVFAVDRAAEPILRSYAEQGSQFAVVVALCTDSRLLTYRYSNSALGCAVYYGLARSSTARDYQLQALSEPQQALRAYLSAIEHLYRHDLGIGATITGYIDNTLRFTVDAYLLNALMVNVAQQIKLVASIMLSPWSAVAIIILLGLGLRWTLMKIPPLLARLISARASMIVAVLSLLIAELLWTLPVIGVLSAMGGGSLDNQWAMTSLAGVELDRVYDFVFSASAQIHHIPLLLCVPFAIVICLKIEILTLYRAGVILTLSPRATDFLRQHTLYPLERNFLDAYSNGESFRSWLFDSYVYMKFGLFVGWVLALSVVPPVVTVLLFLRSLTQAVDFYLNQAPLRQLARADQKSVSQYAPGNKLVFPADFNTLASPKPARILLEGLAIAATSLLLVGGLYVADRHASTQSALNEQKGQADIPSTGLSTGFGIAAHLDEMAKSDRTATEAAEEVVRDDMAHPSEIGQERAEQRLKFVPGPRITSVQKEPVRDEEAKLERPPVTVHNHVEKRSPILSGVPLPLVDLSGEWRGSYNCVQGITPLVLTIESGSNTNLEATFRFGGGQAAASGEFHMKGDFDEVKGSLRLKPINWIARPAGYQAVGLSAEVDLRNGLLVGTINWPGCSWVKLRKTAKPDTSRPSR